MCARDVYVRTSGLEMEVTNDPDKVRDRRKRERKKEDPKAD